MLLKPPEEWLLKFQEQSRVLSLELRFTACAAELKLAGERTERLMG